MMAGVAAALTTQTGQIGYLGPLINDETRRLASSAYLGARYAWTNYLKKDPADLKFKVTWIGFWFNIPGVTSDPTQVADDFFNSGYDVVISGIDTTEAVTEAGQVRRPGKKVWAIPYDYEDAIEEAPSVALGVPYFNWGPAYAGPSRPPWTAPGRPTSSGTARTGRTSTTRTPRRSASTRARRSPPTAATRVDKFIARAGRRPESLEGPDHPPGRHRVPQDGEVATDQQVWYLPQLLEGMEGQSVSK